MPTKVRMGAELGGRDFWWTMLLSFKGTFGLSLGLASAAEQVRLTCVCRESCSSCAANGTYGDPGLCVMSPATHSRHSRFPTSLEEFGSPRPLLICCQFFPGPWGWVVT